MLALLDEAGEAKRSCSHPVADLPDSGSGTIWVVEADDGFDATAEREQATAPSSSRPSSARTDRLELGSAERWVPSPPTSGIAVLGPGLAPPTTNTNAAPRVRPSPAQPGPSAGGGQGAIRWTVEAPVERTRKIA